jgi:hypothetical protein
MSPVSISLLVLGLGKLERRLIICISHKYKATPSAAAMEIDSVQDQSRSTGNSRLK